MEKSGRFAQKRLDLSVKSGTIELNFMSVPRYSGRGRMITQDVAVTSREGRVSRNPVLFAQRPPGIVSRPARDV